MSKAFDPRALEQIDSPEATAAAYFSHFRSANVTPQDQVAFEYWLARDESHRRAWAKVERAWKESRAAASDPRILAMRERAKAHRAKPRRAWPQARHLIAASIALAALIGGGLALRHYQPAATHYAALDGRTISTGIGQQASFRMADGSTITVNTDSTVTVAETDSARSTQVKQGEAFFEVAPNQRKPFTVETAGLRVTALGTAFAVRNLDGELRVTLAHGRVRVDLPSGQGSDGAGKPVILTPGMALSWKDGRTTLAGVDTSRTLGWRQGMVDFDRTPLREAIAEVSRYTRQEIVLTDPAIGGQPISGSFRIGVTRGFLQSLEAAGIARVSEEGPERIELAAP